MNREKEYWAASERAAFIRHMRTEERAAATIERYTEEVEHFCHFVGGRPLSKELVLAYKQRLTERCCRASTVNVKLSAVNYYLRYLGLEAYRARLLRIQRRLFVERERELQRAEYQRLLQACRVQGAAKELKRVCKAGGPEERACFLYAERACAGPLEHLPRDEASGAKLRAVVREAAPAQPEIKDFVR